MGFYYSLSSFVIFFILFYLRCVGVLRSLWGCLLNLLWLVIGKLGLGREGEEKRDV